MELTMNQIIDYYAHAPIMFVDMFMSKMEGGSSDSGRHTAPNMAGLIIPLGGSAKFSLDGTPYLMKTGTIVHAGPGMRIDIDVLHEEVWQYVVIHYCLLENDLGKFPYFHEHFIMTVQENNALSEIAHELMKNYITPTNLAKIKTRQLFFKLIETVLMSSAKEVDNDDQMEKAVKFIHEHYEKSILIQNIANELGVERRRFAYLFERYTGLSPLNYLTEVRMRHAKELLRNGCSVMEAAEKVGYSDSFYFSRVFKKQTGLSPTQFKKYR